MNQFAASNPWDADEWRNLVERTVNEGDAEKCRAVFENAVAQFPSSMYVEFEARQKNNEQIKTLFDRCSESVVDLDLWKLYISFVKSQNSENSDEARKQIKDAYELALKHVGLDVDSGLLWKDYIDYVQGWPATNPFEEGLRMDTLRNVYQRAVCIPMEGVEDMWKLYDAFENTLNKITAKKLLADKSPAYMAARTALRDLKEFTDALKAFRNVALPATWSDTEKKIIQDVRSWVQWERSNPLKFPEYTSVTARVTFCYKKALAVLRFNADLWLEAAVFLSESKEIDLSTRFIAEGLKANSRSLLLGFYAAEFYELNMSLDNSKEVFEHLISAYEADYNQHAEKINEIMDSIKQKESGKKLDAPEGDESAEEGEDYDLDPVLLADESYKKLQREREEHKRKQQELGRVLSLVWIQYMKHSRRTEGMKGARQIFSRARKTEYCSHHVFSYSARLEYQCNKDQQVAFKIFEVGMKNFGSNVEFVCQYVDFLIMVADDANIRSLCERTFNTLTIPASRKIWNRLVEFENDYGDLNTVKSLETRLREQSPNEQLDNAVHFARRYAFKDLEDVFTAELGEELKPATPVAMLPTLASVDTLRTIVKQQKDEYHKAAEVVILPSTREEEMLYPPKKKVLSFTPRVRFAKPNQALYAPYIADPDAIRAFESKHGYSTEQPTNGQEKQQQPHQNISPQQHKPPPVHSQQPQQSTQLFLQGLVQRLPPPMSFQGPFLRADDVLQVIQAYYNSHGDSASQSSYRKRRRH